MAMIKSSQWELEQATQMAEYALRPLWRESRKREDDLTELMNHPNMTPEAQALIDKQWRTFQVLRKTLDELKKSLILHGIKSGRLTYRRGAGTMISLDNLIRVVTKQRESND